MGKAIDLSVIAPCYNEAPNLPELVDRTRAALDELGIGWEIVLVDDASSDATWATIEALSADDDRIRGVHHAVNAGLEAGWRSGLGAASGTHVCIIDADLQYQPEDIARLWREFRFRNVDIVQGSRNTLARVRDRRYYYSRGLNWLLNRLFKMNLKDNKSGFIVTRRSVLASILDHRRKYAYFQTFLMVAAHAKGYSYCEVDTLFEERVLGESFVSKLPLRIIFRTFGDLARGWREYRSRSDYDGDLRAFLAADPPARVPPHLSGWRRLAQDAFFLTMPLHHWMISANARLYYEDLLSSQYLSPSRLRAYQEQKLRSLMEHAYYNTSYYRDVMTRAGLRPEDFGSLADLERMPTLDKEACRTYLYRGLIANRYDAGRVLKITTSGSTGEPFVCFADRRQLEQRWAATQRSLEWTGYRFGDRQVRLWHQTIGMSRSQVLREHLDAWFNRRMFIPVFELREDNLESSLLRIREYRPVLVDGYAEAFNLIANYLRDHEFRGLHPKGIMSSAQMLSPESRATIEEVFGCKVFDKYGSREFSGIAYECEAHTGHHVVGENYIVEILKDGRPAAPGEVGEVVITDLNNYTMPLVRYRIGDLAEAIDNSVPCPCGRGLPRIGPIQGRVQSIIVGTERQFVPGTFFAHVIKDFDKAVRKYQIVQTVPGEMDFYVIKGPRFTAGSLDAILAIFREYLGKAMVIRTHFVDHIDMVRTGKHNAVVSRLKIDFQSRSYRTD